MILSLAAIATLVVVGASFAGSPVGLRRNAATGTLVLAALLHLGVSIALSRADTEVRFAPYLFTPWQPVALVVAACLDLAGLWLPVALVPWATPHHRRLAAVAIVAAGAFAAPVFYLPQDIVVINGHVGSPLRLGYTVALIAWGALFAAVGYVIGRRRKSRGHSTSATA